MNNSKEVIILVIMIFVVLVSAAKAEDEYLNFLTEYAPGVAEVENYSLEMEPLVTTEAWGANNQHSLEVGVAATSSLSNVDDDYGLVVTIKTLF